MSRRGAHGIGGRAFDAPPLGRLNPLGRRLNPLGRLNRGAGSARGSPQPGAGSAELDHGADPVLGLHQLETVVDLVECDAV